MSLLAEVRPFNTDFDNSVAEVDPSSFQRTLHLTRSPAIQELYKQIDRVSCVDVPVLFLGESGVGKEYFARHLHEMSHRSRRPFLKVNCAALPSELLESELFGYDQGAFTGATRSKPGQFELCNEGTILLDEIAEMPPSMQAKLLHVLQDQQFSRLGGRRLLRVNVRILAATNVKIEEALAERKFRPDLYYRLNTIVFKIPPLRTRREDIPFLLDDFLSETALKFGVSPRPVSHQVLDACLKYPWPGNVRELQSFVCRLLLREDEEELLRELSHTPSSGAIEDAKYQEPTIEHLGLKSLSRNVRSQAEKQIIEDMLARTCWNRTEAARLLKISYKSLRSKIQQYGITAMGHSRDTESESRHVMLLGK